MYVVNNNETRAPIANPPKVHNYRRHPLPFLELHLGPCSSMGMRRRIETQAALTTIYFSVLFATIMANKDQYNIYLTGTEPIGLLSVNLR